MRVRVRVRVRFRVRVRVRVKKRRSPAWPNARWDRRLWRRLALEHSGPAPLGALLRPNGNRAGIARDHRSALKPVGMTDPTVCNGER